MAILSGKISCIPLAVLLNMDLTGYNPVRDQNNEIVADKFDSKCNFGVSDWKYQEDQAVPILDIVYFAYKIDHHVSMLCANKKTGYGVLSAVKSILPTTDLYPIERYLKVENENNNFDSLNSLLVNMGDLSITDLSHSEKISRIVDKELKYNAAFLSQKLRSELLPRDKMGIRSKYNIASDDNSIINYFRNAGLNIGPIDNDTWENDIRDKALVILYEDIVANRANGQLSSLINFNEFKSCVFRALADTELYMQCVQMPENLNDKRL